MSIKQKWPKFMTMASHSQWNKNKTESEMYLNVYYFLKLKSGNVPFYFRKEIIFLPTVQGKQKSLNILQGSTAL